MNGTDESVASEAERGWRRWYAALATNRAARVGGLIVVALVVFTAFGPLLWPRDPVEQHLVHRLEPPSLAHPLGTDRLGRDVLARLLHGARLSLGVAVVVTGVRLALGTAVGLVAGYVGGWVDAALMRLLDTLLSFPGIVLAIVVAGIRGPSLLNAMVALAVVGWASYARLVRSTVLSVREREFVAASRLLGSSRLHVIRRHVLPSVVGPVVVLATLDVGGVILGAAGLSFLGLGVQPPTPEWGAMLAGGRNHLRDAWWLVNAPGGMILLTALGFNLLGDGLRAALSATESDRVERERE